MSSKCGGQLLRSLASGFLKLRLTTPTRPLIATQQLSRELSTQPSTLPSTKDGKLEGRVAVVIGGSNGIGAACVREFVAAGAKVVIADIKDEDGQQLAEELGPSAYYVHCNVINESDISNTVDLALEKFGSLDIMHNNVGISMKPVLIQNIDIADFDHLLAVCTRSMIIGLKHAARVMIPNQRGAILNTSTVAAIVAGCGPTAYTFAKAGIPHITKQAAYELAKHGIRVNCISPSAVPVIRGLNETRTLEGFENMTFEEYASTINSVSQLKGYKMRAEVFARSALHLVSDDSSCTTGHNLVIDGGFHFMKPFPNPFKLSERSYN